MACNNCNNTSTKCDNLSCGCADTSQTMPCVYNDCSVKGAEQCEDIQCASCVSYCKDTFEASLGQNILQIANGERLDRILQRIVLFMSDANCINYGTSTCFIRSYYKYNNNSRMVWSSIRFYSKCRI